MVLVYGSGYAGGTDAVRVRALQRRLDGAGYSPGPIDGRYGPRTEQAVDLFQSAHGLRVDGIAGPLTLAALRARSNVLSPGAGYAGLGLARSVRCSVGCAATGTRQDRSTVDTDRGRSGR